MSGTDKQKKWRGTAFLRSDVMSTIDRVRYVAQMFGPEDRDVFFDELRRELKNLEWEMTE